MANRNDTSRPPGPASPAGKAPQGETQTAQGPAQQPAPRMPHERDESAHSQAASEPSQQRAGQLAHDDVARGLVDTDKGPVIEEAYRKSRDSAADRERKFRP
ncbi:hypothetical protein [Ramlibacter sp.]|uniref:hypothetical protein n=1 Tax=Ramlibacter sp. TaxID=1917967 RepID=UPI002BBDF8D5|nr:hypothetical protein [Ramlibacter sp.]HWI82930.1 hypothetical protein [Ramlibacter sp.]